MPGFFVEVPSTTGFGVAAASGFLYFFQVGTTTRVAVYSDDACTSELSQPIPLDANGVSANPLYLKAPARMIVQSATYATLFDVERADGTRAELTALVNPTLFPTAGTVAVALENIQRNLGGTDGGFVAQGSTRSGSLAKRMLHYAIDVIEDWGAAGDGVTDDTAAINSAIAQAEAQAHGGEVLLPPGTFVISSAIAITGNVTFRGSGRGLSVILNNSTSGNGVDVTASGDSKVLLRDFAVTAATVSSGAAIAITTGTRPVIRNCAVLLHRTGIGANVNDAKVEDCIVESTDDNAAAIGIIVGTRGRVANCNVISGTANGSGILAGLRSKVTDCYVNKFATGYVMSGVLSLARGCEADTSTTGFQLSGASATARGNCFATTCTTGFSCEAASTMVEGSVAASCTVGIGVTAVDNVHVIDNVCDGTNTTGISINASATGLVEYGNSYSTLTDATNLSQALPTRRTRKSVVYTSAQTAASSTYTPAITTGLNLHVIKITSVSGAQNLTIANTSTTGLQSGDILELVIQNTHATQAHILLGTDYDEIDGTAGITVNLNQNDVCAFRFIWNATGASTWIQVADPTSW